MLLKVLLLLSPLLKTDSENSVYLSTSWLKPLCNLPSLSRSLGSQGTRNHHVESLPAGNIVPKLQRLDFHSNLETSARLRPKRAQRLPIRTVVDGTSTRCSNSSASCLQDFGSPSVEKFLQVADANFDLMITQVLTNDCFFSFEHKFQVPVVGISSVAMAEWISEDFGNPTNPAFIPNVFMDYGNGQTFFERTEHLIMGLFHKVYYDRMIAEVGHHTAQKYFGPEVPSFRSLGFKLDLLLVNTYSSLNLPRPLVAPIMEIGGIHIGSSDVLSEVGT